MQFFCVPGIRRRTLIKTLNMNTTRAAEIATAEYDTLIGGILECPAPQLALGEEKDAMAELRRRVAVERARRKVMQEKAA